MIKPLQDRVVVKRVEEETKTASGIIIPGSQTEKPSQGEIVSVGPGYRNDNGGYTELTVKTGNIVIFTKFAGNEVKHDGEDYLIMRESDILGIIG